MRTVIYGLGGYDPDKPNDNIIEIIDVPDLPAQEITDAAADLA